MTLLTTRQLDDASAISQMGQRWSIVLHELERAIRAGAAPETLIEQLAALRHTQLNDLCRVQAIVMQIDTEQAA